MKLKRSLSLLAAAFLSVTVSATVYRPGLVQAKFVGSDIGFTSSVVPVLVTNLLSQTEFQTRGDLDWTYGTFMANFSAGSDTTAYPNAWSGKTCAWNGSYTLFAYEGEIYLTEGSELALGGCFDDGSAARVDGNDLFTQNKGSGYSSDCTILTTFTAPRTGWYPINAWVWDWSSGKNIRNGYVSGVAYNLVGNMSQPKDASIWSKLEDDGKMSFLRAPTREDDFMTVFQVGTSGDNLVVLLDAARLPAEVPEAEVILCWGETDGGASTLGWDHVRTVGTVTQATKASKLVFSVDDAADAASVRVCLAYTDGAASASRLVSCFEDWSEVYSNLQPVDVTAAVGTISLTSEGYCDEMIVGSLTYLGEGATSVTSLVQFCQSQDFSGTILESAPTIVTQINEASLFNFTATYGEPDGYVRIKMVNSKGVESYTGVIAYTPPARISFADYTMKIDYTVAGDFDDTDDLRVLVRLSEATVQNFDYDECAADGSDLAVFSSDGLFRYAFEIDTWNPQGESCLWVRLPTAAKGASFVLCYGRTGATPLSNGAKTWSNYTGVWHMGEAAGLAVDATGNGLDGVPTSKNASYSTDTIMVAYDNGVVGKARVNCNANGKSLTYMSVPSYDSFGLGDTFTLSGWFLANSTDGFQRLFSRKNSYNDNDSFEIELYGGSKTAAVARGAGTQSITVNWPDLTSAWMHLALVYNGTTLSAYVNGALAASGEISPATDNARPLSFGNNSNGSEQNFNGQYDEIRLSKGAKSASRVAAEYAVMHDPAFLSASPAISPSPLMPVLTAADVAWVDDETTVSVNLAAGVGKIVATFTDEGTGTEYEIVLAEELDARAGAQAKQYVLNATQLPEGKTYTWVVRAENETLQRSTSVASQAKYYSGEADPYVRYVSTTGSDDNDGLLLATAKATVQAAVEALGADGGTVYVDDGEYAFQSANTAAITITTPVQVVGRSRDPSKVRLTCTGSTKRVFCLDCAGAGFRSVTLSGGAYKEGATGFISAKGGTLYDCVVTGASYTAWDAGGAVRAEGGRIVRTVFRGNVGANNGSALYLKNSAVAENCLFCGNTGTDDGTVRLNDTALLLNSTIACNKGNKAAGVYVDGSKAYAKNCMIFLNRTDIDVTGYQHVWKNRQANFVNCAAEIAVNNTCVAGAHGFTDPDNADFRLLPDSVALDRATDYASSGALSTNDLAGAARIIGSAADLGCYERVGGSFDVGFHLSAAAGLVPATVTFTAAVAEAAGTVTYSWDFDGDGTVDQSGTSPTTTWTYQTAGAKKVILTVSDGVSTKSLTREAAFVASPVVLYANVANGANAVFPYDTPETAATNLQDAVDAAGDGSTVLVADGAYVRSLRSNTEGGLLINKGLRLLSVSGDPSTCIISNRVRSAWGNADHRCLRVNHPNAFVAGFTLAYGSAESLSGGCLFIDECGGTVSNCLIKSGYVGNWAGNGPGAYVAGAGFLTHTIIEDCLVAPDPRQSAFAVLAVAGRVENCLVRDILDERSQNLVTVYKTGKFLNCTVVNGRCRKDNDYDKKRYDGGYGIYAEAGGTAGRIVNTVVVGVTHPDYDDPSVTLITPWRGDSAAFANCATDGAEAINVSCILADKSAFADFEKGDYRLAKGSVLIGKGTAVTLSSETDLAGTARIGGANIDIGCYEMHSNGLRVFIR